jgi:hypothetical protein
VWKVIANAGTGFMGLLATGMPAKKLTLPSPLTAAIAAIRRGSSMDKPRRVKSFLAHGRPHTVLRRIIRFALTGACLVEALDETAGQVVLNDSASWTEGFFIRYFLRRRETKGQRGDAAGWREGIPQAPHSCLQWQSPGFSNLSICAKNAGPFHGKGGDEEENHGSQPDSPARPDCLTPQRVVL